jgi:hypothetical protein
MKSETVQLFGTLEVLSGREYSPTLWETNTQGEFNIWNLLISEGFVNPTDSELAFEHWQNMECWGTPTDPTNYEYAPLRSERKSNDWNETIAIQRQKTYNQLQQFLKTYLQNQQAYRIAIPQSSRQFEWNHPIFSIFILVGQTTDGQWICLASTVPDQVGIHSHKRNSSGSADVSNSTAQGTTNVQLATLLDQLQPIEIYGYYHGGYNYSYSHRIVSAIASNRAAAIEYTLQAAEMLILEKTAVEHIRGTEGNRKMSQFMNQCLSDRTIYNLSFWDIAYSYEMGKTPTDDWIGVSSRGEFEYNP